jgi:hypothetical protein
MLDARGFIFLLHTHGGTMRLLLALALVGLFAVPTRTEAQEVEKWDGVNWYRIVHVDFHNGKTGEARRIIEEHFMPAADDAGTAGPDMLLWHETGEWDLTIIWRMKEGPASMEWRRSPDNVKWWKSFSELEGGDEAAELIQKEYSALIARSTSSIARS